MILLRDWAGHLLLVQGVWSFFPMLLMGCVVAIQLKLDREADKRYDLYTCIYALIGLVLLLVALFVRCWIDFFMLPACIVALTCSLKSPDVKCRAIALQCVVPTFAFAFCICLGSNQGSYLIASVMAAGIVPAFVLLFMICDRFVIPVTNGRWRRFALILMALIMIVQIAGETVARYRKVWWDEPISTLNFKFKEGPECGIITSVKIGEWRESLIRMACEDLPNGDGKKVLFCSASLWQYFAGPWRVGSYSAWMTDLDSSNSEANHMSRLVRFFELNPSKLPDVVSVASSDDRTVSKFIEKYGYQIKRIGADRIVLTKCGVGK